MKTHFKDYKGDYVEAPHIKGEIIINAFDGSVILFKDRHGIHLVRYCLELSKHETFKHAFNHFNHAIKHYMGGAE